MERHLSKKIVVFGAGHLAKAILPAICQKHPDVELTLYTPSGHRALALASFLKQKASSSLADLPRDADYYLLLFKPKDFSSFEFAIQNPRAKIISFMAAISHAAIQAKWPHHQVARVMPNTPCELGLGATPFYAPSDEAEFVDLLGGTGELYSMASNDLLDIATPYTGSSPAFLFEMGRIMAQDLSSRGIEEWVADRMIRQLFLGVGHLMQSPKSLADLRDAVTSKKGVTEKGLESL